MVLDIHSHIIPNVDDGSNSLDDSIEMIKKCINEGVTDIIATPHHIHHKYEASAKEILTSFNLLKDKAKELNLPINLYLGQEIFFSHENISNMLKSKELLTMNNSNVILLEFAYTHAPHDIFEILYNLRIDGYKVILAHVERYSWMDFSMINQLSHEEGVYIQVNAGALLGKEGLRSKLLIKKLLKHNLVDFVASDMHYFRQANIVKALNKIKDTSKLNKDIFKLKNI